MNEDTGDKTGVFTRAYMEVVQTFYDCNLAMRDQHMAQAAMAELPLSGFSLGCDLAYGWYFYQAR
jgi:hypothetical protein